MRPLLVRMQGFGPFRDATEVDFRDVELVALMGPTGSGKSTILDAITFALFGRIARLDAKVVAPVVNALSQEARVAFDFELAGDLYTAIRVVRRTKTGASTREARLERGDDTIAATSDEVGEAVERLLGMNFDRFTKVAFLPQGKFAEFLHDKPAERQKLLRILLGLGIYEQVGRRAREIASTASGQLEVLRPQLAEAGVTDEQIADLDADADRLRTALDDLRQRLRARAQIIAELERLEKEAEEFGMLALAVDAVSVPPPVRELGERIADADSALDEAELALHDAEAALADAHRARADGPDAARLQRWRDDRARATELARRVEELEQESERTRLALAEAEAAQRAFHASLAEASEATAAAEAAEDAAEAALAATRTTDAIERDRSEHAGLTELSAAIEAAEHPDGDLAHAEAEEARAADAVAIAQSVFTAAQDARRLAERDGHVAILARSLAAGDECPVCRQTITSLPDHEPAAELDAADAAVQRAEADLAAARREQAEAGRAGAGARARLDDLRSRHARLRERVAELPALEDLDAEAAERGRLETRLAEARADADSARRSERGRREGPEAVAIAQQVREADTVAAGSAASLDSARSALVDLRDALADAPDAQTIHAQLAEAARLADAETAAANARRSAAAAVAAAKRAVDEIRRDEAGLRRTFGEVRDAFVPLDPPQPGHDSLLADWQAFAVWAADLRAPLEDHHLASTGQARMTKTELHEADEAARAAVSPFFTDEPEPADEPSITELEPVLTQRLVRAEAAVTSARERREHLAGVRDKVAELEESREVHELLGVQLRSSGFEQWLLDEVIQALVGRASERLLELSRGQYSIEADDMVFQVRDHRNGDELRDARTLSGGETFLASLALALALAESIEEMAPTETPPVECLFLDEGFGTLDPDTLDVVASAIEELGASGRMVGVITHIRELAERMPVRFEVGRLPTTSVVEKVVT